MLEKGTEDTYKKLVAITYLFGDDGAIAQRLQPNPKSRLPDERIAASAKAEWVASHRTEFNNFIHTYCSSVV